MVGSYYWQCYGRKSNCIFGSPKLEHKMYNYINYRKRYNKRENYDTEKSE